MRRPRDSGRAVTRGLQQHAADRAGARGRSGVVARRRSRAIRGDTHGLASAIAIGLAIGATNLAWPQVREIARWGATFVTGAEPQTADAVALLGNAVQVSVPVALAA